MMDTPKVKVSDYSRVLFDERVGEGSWGTVKKIEHVPSSTLYAVKSSTKSKSKIGKVNSSIFRDGSLTREADFLLRVKHPNIVSARTVIHSVEKVEDSFGAPKLNHDVLLVMELCDTDLARRLRTDMTISEKLSHMMSLVLVVKFLHDNDYTHGDLKLENILLKDGILKLADFGHIIHRHSGKFKRDMFHNAILFSCPEMLCSNWKVVRRKSTIEYVNSLDTPLTSDISFEDLLCGDFYTLGCILLNIYIGRSEKTLLEVIVRTFETSILSPSERIKKLIPSDRYLENHIELYTLIDELMEGDPRKRLTDFDVIIHRLCNALPCPVESLKFTPERVDIPRNDVSLEEIQTLLLLQDDIVKVCNATLCYVAAYKINLYTLSKILATFYRLLYVCIKNTEGAILFKICEAMITSVILTLTLAKCYDSAIVNAPYMFTHLRDISYSPTEELGQFIIKAYQYLSGVVFTESIYDHYDSSVDMISCFRYYTLDIKMISSGPKAYVSTRPKVVIEKEHVDLPDTIITYVLRKRIHDVFSDCASVD